MSGHTLRQASKVDRHVLYAVDIGVGWNCLSPDYRKQLGRNASSAVSDRFYSGVIGSGADVAGDVLLAAIAPIAVAAAAGRFRRRALH